MVARGSPIPKKLKHDFIVEAIFEIRFQAPDIPEVMVGRLVDCHHWASLKRRQLPAYDMPPQLRQMDESLRFHPVIELYEGGDEPRSVRIGHQVLSYHRTNKYVGWARFRAELEQAIDALFTAANDLPVLRLGLRYLNALRPDVHGINSVQDLDLVAQVGGDVLRDSLNVNFNVEGGADMRCLVRVATTDFVQGTLKDAAAVLVDVDVSTKAEFSTKDIKFVKSWVEAAHNFEKTEFFHLLKKQTIDGLKEE